LPASVGSSAAQTSEISLIITKRKTGLINIESGDADPKTSTLSTIQRALEDAGIEFTNGGEPGVKLRKAK
jgi:hypothetical protein